MFWNAKNQLRNRLFKMFLSTLCVMIGVVSGEGLSASGQGVQVQTAPPDSSLTRVIVQLEDLPIAAYAGGIQGLKATGPRHTGAAKLDMRSAETSAYTQYLDKKMQAFQETVVSSIPGAKVIYRYRTVFGGVSVVLPENRLNDLAALPGVKNVYPDRFRKKDTDSSPAFISAPKLWGKVGGQENAGQGIIIGVIDTGVWPEHLSFSNPDPEGVAYPAPPPQWVPGAPVCEAPTDGTSPLTCNNKLIGARKFLNTYKQETGLGPGEFDSPRDSDGHGTHTASTAAGNYGVNASVLGVPIGVVSGIAPRAHVAVYKALGAEGGRDSDLVAAIDQAVADLPEMPGLEQFEGAAHAAGPGGLPANPFHGTWLQLSQPLLAAFEGQATMSDLACLVLCGLWSLATWLIFLGAFALRGALGGRRPRICMAVIIAGAAAIGMTLLWVNLSAGSPLHAYAS